MKPTNRVLRSRCVRILLLIVPAASVLSASVRAAEPAPVRVLLVTGVDYAGHKWKETSPVVREVIERDRRLEVRIVDDLEILATDVIFDYDVLLVHFKNYAPLKRAEAAQANMNKFVEDGGGMVLLHFACGAFEEWDGFVDLAGRVWDKTKRGHDPHREFTVEIVDKEHPVTAAMENFNVTDELYTCLGGDREIHVLATAKSVVDGKDYPMAFVRTVGKGRVLHTVLGHDVTAFRAPGVVTLMQRACVWAAGQTP